MRAATISGVPVVEAIEDTDWLESEFITTVQGRGASVIGARGSSSAASAAKARVVFIIVVFFFFSLFC